MKEASKDKVKKKKRFKILRFVGKSLLVLLIVCISLVLFVRSPWGQNIIVNKVTSYISDKTNTRVDIERFFLTFDGNLMLEGLYLEDLKGDTLVYSKSLEAGVAIWPLIKGDGIGISSLDWEGVRATVSRKDTTQGFNFQFLIDALAAPTEESVTNEPAPIPEITLGDLSFKDFDIDYVDDVTGIDSKFVIGSMLLEVDTFDLEEMAFNVSKTVLKDARINYHQSPIPPSDEEVPLPKLVLDEITLQNVVADYTDVAMGLEATLDIDSLFTEIPLIDLQTNTIDITTVELANSEIGINMNSDVQAATTTNSPQEFEWPAFDIEVGKISLSRNNISYQVGNAVPEKGVFNPNAIFLNDLSYQGTNLYLKDTSAGTDIKTLRFNEASGIQLKNFTTRFEITDRRLIAEDIALALNNNSLQGRFQLDYNSLSSFINAPESGTIALNFPTFQLDAKEIFQFQPSLKENEYLVAVSEKLISGSLKAQGVLSSIQISNADIQWGASTEIVMSNGVVKNATDPDNLQFDFPTVQASTTRTDLINFVKEEDLSIRLPEKIQLKGRLEGTVDAISTDIKVTTSQGIASVKGMFENKKELAFNANINIQEYRLDKLLQNEKLGPISLTINGKGSGTKINTLDADLTATISSFQLNEYAIKDLEINGAIKNGKGTVKSTYKDENLNMNLEAFVVADSIAPEANINMNIIGADLQALGLMQRDVRTGLQLKANFKGNAKNYEVDGSIIDGVVVYDNQTYLLGSFDAAAYVHTDTTSISIRNKILDLQLESNTDPQTFGNALQRHVFSYFYRDTEVPDSITKPVRIKVKGTISQAPLLNEVFLVNVKDIDTITIAVDFNEKSRQLKANVVAPHINYAGNEIDSLAFSIATDRDDFNFDFGFNEINAGPFSIKKTSLTGIQVNNELDLEFLSYDDEVKLVHVQSRITGNRERLQFKVVPEDLILNKNAWTIPASNEVIYTENKLEFNDFKITKNGQSIAVTDKFPSIEKDHIAIDYTNFKLREILDYLNPEERFADGNLNGDFIIENPFTDVGVVADLTIDKLQVLDVPLGTLTMDAKALGNAKYDFNMGIKGGEVQLDLTGDYLAKDDGALLDLNLDISQFNMKALEGFTLGEVSDASGFFTGKFAIDGPIAEPNYKGELNFKEARFEVTKFNTPFTLPNEKLNIDNQGLSLNKFTILDANKNKLVLSGSVGTKNLINPSFNLSVKANNFQILNATEKDNDFLYGTAAFNADATLTGDLQIPKLDLKLTVTPTTDVTYIMPSAAVNIEEKDGVVTFVNRENPDAILTNTEEQTAATVTGFDISSLITVGKGAKVKIIIDEETEDNFQVSGEGDFNFTMRPNGRMNLVGVYNVVDGHYEMNLYNLVNRRFEIVKGSRISWSGDPFDADLDVKALYDVEASASALMAAQTSGADPSIRGKFRQVLPFYVYLNIDGELLQPKISFNLDMPKDEQGAIGGQVYGRIQQLNQQEAELNKQVFSLLVLNRFYPEPGSDGSRGGAVTVARDNLNDALSDQLNVFSDKILGDTGVELDFGLDSYTDYQGESPTERTQLDIAAQKKLFDDRLIVRVGSEVDLQGSSSTGEATPLIGNVSLEYILTEDGRYRLKGFRRNEFENVIDGQTITSGIALIFTQEFNKFSELTDALFFKKAVKKKEEEEKKESDDEKEEKNDLPKIEGTKDEEN
ncbi:translocation/assembly module TamB [uncultured Dokdonia sp.]|uniref:translocation/assembly module TamB domain-containing protein n=1 Tax=uncultured Dokdonia sp. TaxID=575653 RepID=UPI0026306730|nr:translocation/assembly module TamB [uncultured Dokdonia sp.]